jgi:Gpi18-like mannosyltransferase
LIALEAVVKVLALLFIVLLIVSLAIRIALIHVTTYDYIYYLHPWFEYMHQHGLSGIATVNANYNDPYLILLWLASYLPFSPIVSVKLISIICDYILAFGVFLIVRHFKPKGFTKYVSVLAILFAPTVIQNGSMWGQCDVIYTTFIVYSLYATLKNKLYTSWLLWGIAFAFKLQAIFFLPFLLFMMLYKRRAFLGPILAFLVITVLSIPPLFFGKPLSGIINVYVGQTASTGGANPLALYIPNIYQLVTNAFFAPIKKVGVLFAGFVTLFLLALVLIRKFDQKSLIVLATTFLLVLPFLLPQMHERYYYTAEIFLIITACIIPRMIWPAALMQLITSIAYVPYFSNDTLPPPIPYTYLALGVLAIIGTYVYYLYKNTHMIQGISDKV